MPFVYLCLAFVLILQADIESRVQQNCVRHTSLVALVCQRRVRWSVTNMPASWLQCSVVMLIISRCLECVMSG